MAFCFASLLLSSVTSRVPKSIPIFLRKAVGGTPPAKIQTKSLGFCSPRCPGQGGADSQRFRLDLCRRRSSHCFSQENWHRFRNARCDAREQQRGEAKCHFQERTGRSLGSGYLLGTKKHHT